jgi:hypothetical protein
VPDVLEHLTFPRAAAKHWPSCSGSSVPGGELLVSVPNLAHLQSRVHFLPLGRLIHTASLEEHPGDRPAGEFIDLATRAGFRLVSRRGHFPHGAGADALHPPIAGTPRLAAPAAHAPAPGSGLVLPQHHALRASLTEDPCAILSGISARA